MKQRLSHRIVLGSLLFGMFFGAGNLIFPVSIGQNAAKLTTNSIFGFVISGVGLACLAVIFTAKSKKTSLEESLHPYGKIYARIFTILLLLTIGPLFALPRTATVPYEVSIRTIFPSANHQIGLFIYSSVFFIISALLALKPTKIKELIGVFINPIFLLMLGLFFMVFLINPMGSIKLVDATPIYNGAPFIQGFQDGYQTMDVLAAMMFGFVVIHANDKAGEVKDQFKDIVVATIFAGLLMTLIYAMLAFMGASSVNILEVSSNGGLALGEMFVHYFGRVGLIFFGVLITFACLKTAIGLIVSVSTYFSSIFKNVSYNLMVLLVSVVAFGISNFGLEAIIKYAVPVLNFIYPLAIVHVFIGLFLNNWEEKTLILKSVLAFSVLGSVMEVLKGFTFFEKTYIFKIYTQTLPLSNIGLSWITFVFIGLLVGYIMSKYQSKTV